jgi:hypothetical protein
MKFVYKNIKRFIKQWVTDSIHMNIQIFHSRVANWIAQLCIVKPVQCWTNIEEHASLHGINKTLHKQMKL